jgi:hypothetical protein
MGLSNMYSILFRACFDSIYVWLLMKKLSSNSFIEQLELSPPSSLISSAVASGDIDGYH